MEIDNGKKYEEAIKIHSEVVKTMDGVGYGLLKDGETFYRYGTDADGILFSMREAYEIHRFFSSRDTYWKERVRKEVESVSDQIDAKIIQRHRGFALDAGEVGFNDGLRRAKGIITKSLDNLK